MLEATKTQVQQMEARERRLLSSWQVPIARPAEKQQRNALSDALIQQVRSQSSHSAKNMYNDRYESPDLRNLLRKNSESPEDEEVSHFFKKITDSVSAS